ncbi:MAG: ABC transporter permease [Deltaproteobacteria bacterium]|nr:ABC transporter permease [Deltaproteobacteria bacterium]
MTYLDSVLAAVRALRANVLRSILTTLGIIIGVSAVIIMIGVGAGAQARMDELINSLGSNLIMVLPGSSMAGGVRLGTGTRPSITEDDAAAIQREIPSVQVAAPSIRGSGQVVFGNLNWSTLISGITPEYLVAREWEIQEGRAFTPEEVKGAAKVALVGETVVKNLFPGQDPLGQIVRIRRVPFKIIGVLKAKGQTPMGRDQDDAVFVPITTARKRVLGGRELGGKSVGVIFIKAWSADLVSQTVKEVTQVLRQRHRLRKGQEADFFIRNLSQLLETRAESSRAMSLLLAAIASVSLIVGGIGIMNIMLVSVTERTREIGLRMALGARSRDILAQFLTESVTLSLIGGIIGTMIGIGGSIFLASFGEWPTIIEARSVILAFSFSAGVGVFFGFYPARKASLLDPIDALRYE